MQKRAELAELPQGNLFFTLKEVTYRPETPRLEEPFVVKGKVELFGIPFLPPLWVIAKVTAPETWWEHYIPIWGSPTVGEGQLALGGDFEIIFPKGFDREGEFSLAVEVYLGPTYTLDSITLPPFPPVASEETVFIVAGDVPPEEAGFRNFRISSYSKNGGTPVMPPGVLELEVGDRCRVNVGFDHRYGAVTAEFHAAIWTPQPWDPHDEILSKEQSFSVPSSVDWESWEGSIDIIVTSAISPGSEYGLYVKIMGITGGDIFTEYLANVITIVGAVLGFNLARPTASPYSAPPGPVQITCPVTSLYSESVTAAIKCIVYEGSILPGHGTKLWESTQTKTIAPGETVNVQFMRTSVAGTIDRRDVEVEVRVGGQLIKESEWDDVYYVTAPPEEIIDFTLSRPTAYPYRASPGPVSITCPVTSQSTKSATAAIKCIVYEGSILPGHGTKLWSNTKTVTIAPGETVNVQFMRTSVVGTIDRRDVEVEVRVGGKLIVQDEWDDVYYVTAPPEEIIDFSLSRPTASPYRAPPGPVLITCPVTSQSTKSVTAQVKVIVYEGSILPGHGTKLWESTKTITISPNETKAVQFIRTSVVGTIDRRDVEVEVRVGGKLIVQDEWDDVYYVEEAPPVGISFQMGIWGAPPDFPSYDYWMCWYWDSGIGGFVSDEKWYRPSQKIQFTNIKSGDNGYVSVFLKKNSTVSRQYTSPRFDAVNGGNYTYDVGINYIYGA